MGKAFERFGALRFENEQEVNQNFLIPLLTEFLGYALEEILPEYNFRTVQFQVNRRNSITIENLLARPDYVLTLDGDQYVCVCECKAPDQTLDEHLGQLVAYCSAVGTNLLLITNGSDLRVYDAHALIFQARDIGQLDLQFKQLDILISRRSAERLKVLDRIRLSDPTAAGVGEDVHAARASSVAVAISDYREYLHRVVRDVPASADLPQALREAFGTGLRTSSAEIPHQFGSAEGRSNSRPYSVRDLLDQDVFQRLLLVGESGIGKSSLMRQLVVEQARRCLALESDVLPVLVELRRHTGGRVEPLIQDSFARFGATVTIDEIRRLLSQNRMLLLLDAYDEAFDMTAPTLDRALESIVDIAGNSRIIVTTRPFCHPRIGFGSELHFEPLTGDAITKFLALQLGREAQSQFIVELKRNHLWGEASNTLLLSFLVLLYQRSRRLPSSRGQILAEVIDGVNKWEESKPERLRAGLRWRGVKLMLERLAFRVVGAGDGYRLDLAAVDAVVSETLAELKQVSRAPQTLTIDDALREMEATGFVRCEAQGIIFWHRALMEYFAASEAARRLDTAQLDPEPLAHFVAWDAVLPMALARASAASALIRSVAPVNIFCAAHALAEMEAPEGALVDDVTAGLASRCRSAVHSNRHEAATLLCRLRGGPVDLVLRRLLDDAPVGVQMIALREIARRGLPEAREIVSGRIDWEPATLFFLEGVPQSAVLEALGELGDAESQRAILTQWKARRDMFTSGAAATALIATIERGTFVTEMRDALVDWLLSDSDEHLMNRCGDIARVLIRLGDTSIATRLADCVERSAGDGSIVNMHAERILASFDDAKVVGLLLGRAANEALPVGARIRFARVLSESQASLPVEGLRALFDGTDNHRLRAFALAGLSRHPYPQIEALVHAALLVPQSTQVDQLGWEYAFLQATAFRVLAHHHRLDLLLSERFHPSVLWDLGIDALVEAVSQQRLVTFSGWFKELLDKVSASRLKTRLAYALADLGEVTTAVALIDRILVDAAQEAFVPHEVVQGAHRLPEAQALRLVREVWSQTTVESGDGGHLRDVCIEALERIGSHAACEELCGLAEQVAQEPESLEIERTLRGVALLATSAKEEWLLDFLARHPTLEKFGHNRALYALGFIGTEKAIPALERFGGQGASEEARDMCFRSIQAIYRRRGRVWFGGEEIGALDNALTQEDRPKIGPAQEL
jgi:NACHT domain/Type I restriction enzyme R protein N terminus (HSDR_N)